MIKHVSSALALTLCLGATALSAQTAADPKADLTVIETRAKGDPKMERLLRQLRENMERGQLQSRDMRDVLMRYMPDFNGFDRENRPYEYRLEAQRRQAQIRAELLSDIMRADLDGDWQISRAEVAAVVRLSRGGSVADVFVLGDTDGNNLLDMQELQAAINSMAETRGHRDGNRPVQSLRLFDLDDDGILTLDEVDRSLAALAL